MARVGARERSAALGGRLEASSDRVLAAVEGSSRIAGVRVTLRRAMRERILYVDTPERTLERHGVTLALGRKGSAWEATAESWAASEGPVRVQRTVTARVGSPRADGSFSLPRGRIQSELGALVGGRRLVPRLRISAQRSVLETAARGRRRARIVLDRMTLFPPTGRQPLARFFEVELTGPRSLRQTLAASLERRFGLEPVRIPAAHRGLAAVEGSVPPFGTEAIEGGDTLAEAARKVVGRHLRRLRAQDPGARLGRDPEALHDMRVACRRLRAALPALDEGFPERLRVELLEELRWLGRLLGGVRDLDVQLARFESLRSDLRRERRATLEPFLAHLSAERDLRRREMLEGLEATRYFRLLVRLEQLALGMRPRSGGRSSSRAVASSWARARLRKDFGRLLRVGDRVASRPSPVEMHRLRIRLKRVRYLIEFFGELAGKPGSRLVRRLVRLQDFLGERQDARVGVAALRGYFETGRGPQDRRRLVALGEILGREEARAAGFETSFPSAWRRFSKGRTGDHLEKVLARLRKAARRGGGAGDEGKEAAG